MNDNSLYKPIAISIGNCNYENCHKLPNDRNDATEIKNLPFDIFILREILSCNCIIYFSLDLINGLLGERFFHGSSECFIGEEPECGFRHAFPGIEHAFERGGRAGTSIVFFRMICSTRIRHDRKMHMASGRFPAEYPEIRCAQKTCDRQNPLHLPPSFFHGVEK